MAKSPKPIDLDKYSLDELTQLQRDVEKAIKTASERRRKEALAAAQAAAKEHGFSLAELSGSAPKASSRGKSPAKYRHPDNPELTWSGRGRQPKWVKEILEADESLDDYLIQ